MNNNKKKMNRSNNQIQNQKKMNLSIYSIIQKEYVRLISNCNLYLMNYYKTLKKYTRINQTSLIRSLIKKYGKQLRLNKNIRWKMKQKLKIIVMVLQVKHLKNMRK